MDGAGRWFLAMVAVAGLKFSNFMIIYGRGHSDVSRLVAAAAAACCTATVGL